MLAKARGTHVKLRGQNPLERSVPTQNDTLKIFRTYLCLSFNKCIRATLKQVQSHHRE